jgi:DNA polymerase III delta prime subunit
LSNKRTILLYGRTNSGKTTQIGVLAEDLFKATKKKTRLCTADRGGTETVKPYIDLGIIDVVSANGTSPWIFLNKVVRGYVRDAKGKWIIDEKRNADVGCYAFESMRSFAELLMEDMAVKAANGVNIGGGSNISFQVSGDGESLKVAGSNMSHYMVAQSKMTEEIWASQKLDADYIVWTSSVSKDEDPNSSGKVLGPDVVGKALTADVPRWFDLTFRIDVLPSQGGKAERHILYLGTHVDINAGNVAAMGNVRLPLDAPPLQKLTIEPADIVEALKQLDGGSDKATDVIRKRLGL